MTVAESTRKWSRYQGKESSAYQEHFNDLCRFLGQPQLKKRTLTNLHNERPAWLALAHQELDAAQAKPARKPSRARREDEML